MPSDVDRILGQLEASHAALIRSIDRMEQRQEEQMRKLDAHFVEDRQLFDLLRNGQRENLERIQRMEPIADTVDMHAAAIAQLERKIANQEEAEHISKEVLAAQIATNAKWRNTLIAGAGVASFGLGAGAQGIVKAVLHFFVVMFGGK